MKMIAECPECGWKRMTFLPVTVANILSWLKDLHILHFASPEGITCPYAQRCPKARHDKHVIIRPAKSEEESA